MRSSVEYANGASCDKCRKTMLPKDVYKLKIYKLKETNSSNTGEYETVKVADLCEKCYNALTNIIDLREPRRRY